MEKKSKRNYFDSHSKYQHGNEIKVGVLVVNLGTPDEPTAKALKPYLKRFLSDPRVIELPKLLWWLILNGIVLRTRPKKSAHAYSTIWTDKGSPLTIFMNGIMEKLSQRIHARYDNVVLQVANSYSQPMIKEGLDKLKAQNCGAIVVLPLYPQYSGTTVGSVYDDVAKALMKWRWVPQLHFINAYYDEDLYIDGLVNSIKQHREKHGDAEKLIMSFHGLPRRYLIDGDPYFCQCQKTGRLVAEKLGLTKDQYQVTFQSLFGKEEWLQPYTDMTIEKLAKNGVKSMQVICPGFSVDCIETLEEIDGENREIFEENGGENFQYIPCLNDTDEHIDLFEKLVSQHLDFFQSLPRFQNASAELTQTAEITKHFDYGKYPEK